MLPDKQYQAICSQVIGLLRKERERRGVSKYKMAELSGLSEQMIGYVERGLRNPSLETVIRMACALNVDVGEIINRALKKVSRKDKPQLH